MEGEKEGDRPADQIVGILQAFSTLRPNYAKLSLSLRGVIEDSVCEVLEDMKEQEVVECFAA